MYEQLMHFSIQAKDLGLRAVLLYSYAKTRRKQRTLLWKLECSHLDLNIFTLVSEMRVNDFKKDYYDPFLEAYFCS